MTVLADQVQALFGRYGRLAGQRFDQDPAAGQDRGNDKQRLLSRDQRGQPGGAVATGLGHSSAFKASAEEDADGRTQAKAVLAADSSGRVLEVRRQLEVDAAL